MFFWLKGQQDKLDFLNDGDSGKGKGSKQQSQQKPGVKKEQIM